MGLLKTKINFLLNLIENLIQYFARSANLLLNFSELRFLSHAPTSESKHISYFFFNLFFLIFFSDLRKFSNLKQPTFINFLTLILFFL